MSYSEPASKRRRITESNSLQMHPQELPIYSPESGEAFHSPLSSSNGRYYQDGFSHNPGYIASQEELRSMLIMTAQSAAPSRRGSPVNGEEIESEETLPQIGSGAGSRWSVRALIAQPGQTTECEHGREGRRRSYQSATDVSVLGSVTGKGQEQGPGQTIPGWNRRRIQYLKNYVAEVAPWVCHLKLVPYFLLYDI
jgi:hypothetical protein